MPTEIVFEQQTEVAAPAAVEQVAAPEVKAEEAAPAAQEQQEQQTEQEQERDERGRFKPGVQERINELTRKRGEAERERDYWKQRAESTNAPPAEAAKKPVLDDFKSADEYVEALADWKAQEKVKEAFAQRDQEAAKRAEQAVQKTREQSWAERMEATRKTHTDIDEVIGSADVPITDAMREALLDSEKGPQLAYHLAKNPAEAARIAGLSATQAALALGRIEASLAAPAPAQKPVSKAPAPMGALNTATASGTKDPSTMSMDEYKAWRKTSGAWWAR